MSPPLCQLRSALWATAFDLRNRLTGGFLLMRVLPQIVVNRRLPSSVGPEICAQPVHGPSFNKERSDVASRRSHIQISTPSRYRDKTERATKIPAAKLGLIVKAATKVKGVNKRHKTIDP